MKKVKIELNEYTDYCSDGCCTDYGTIIKVNGVELSSHSNDVGTIVTQILEQLGYEVELIELYFCIAEGKFDHDRCLFTVKPRTREEFIKDIPINILLSPGRVTHPVSGYGVQNFLGGDRVYEQAFHFADAVLYIAKKSNQKILISI